MPLLFMQLKTRILTFYKPPELKKRTILEINNEQDNHFEEMGRT